MVGGRRRADVVVDGPNGPYLRAHADSYVKDNVLALDERPVRCCKSSRA